MDIFVSWNKYNVRVSSNHIRIYESYYACIYNRNYVILPSKYHETHNIRVLIPPTLYKDIFSSRKTDTCILIIPPFTFTFLSHRLNIIILVYLFHRNISLHITDTRDARASKHLEPEKSPAAIFCRQFENSEPTL